MRKAFGFLLVAAALLLASGAQAQSIHVKADVPFDFVIGNTTYGAGTYDFKTVNASAVVLAIQGENGKGVAIPNRCASLEMSKTTQLVFHRVGGEYFLYQIWTAGNDVGRELPQPKREALLARQGQSEDVIIAANLVK